MVDFHYYVTASLHMYFKYTSKIYKEKEILIYDQLLLLFKEYHANLRNRKCFGHHTNSVVKYTFEILVTLTYH